MPERPNLVQVAVGLLGRREHSVTELRDKLLKRAYPAAEVEDCLRELCDRNLLSDHRYADQLVSSALRRGLGPLKVGRMLREKGIAAERIDIRMESLASEWRTACREAARKKFGPGPAMNHKELARRVRFLQSRGFTSDQIRGCMDGWDDHEEC